jgi:hypothetical protein
MKKDEISTVVKNSFKKINRLFHKIVIDFETGDIQEFRVEIKKLRAFFHLLDVEGTIQFKITGKMKTFYGYIGIIRNIQLHMEKIKGYCENSTDNVPASYMTKLEKELEYWKKSTKEFMDFHNNFYNDEDKILAGLPHKLRKTSVKKFVHYIAYELRKSLQHSDDETLHSIRKLLEDLVFNWASVQPYFVPLSAGLSRKDQIESLIEMIGIFRDKCIEVTLLQTYYEDLPEHDKIVLQNIIHGWNIQKQELGQIIFDWLDLIELRPRKVKELSFTGTDHDRFKKRKRIPI